MCDRCFSHASSERDGSDQRLESIVKRVLKDSLAELGVSHAPPGPAPHQATASIPPLQDPVVPSQPSHPSSAQSDSESDTGEPSMGFDYALVPSLVRAVREALNWEDQVTQPPKQRKFFKQLQKEKLNFPFLEELGDVIMDEWGKVERKNSMTSKMARLYPFKEEEVKHLEASPLVDAAVMRLAKHVTLPLEDTVSFRDPLDRRLDSDLKRIYLNAGMACKPVLALATLSKAMEIWVDGLQGTLRSVSEETAANAPIQELMTASAFLGEASIDIIRLLARVMLSSVTAKRALWLRPWVADPASKQAWCRIPFEGSSLFGNKLDSAISRATGGKSGFLPQDRRLLGQKQTKPRRQAPDRFREARSYRPGKQAGRGWRSRQSSFQKSSKNNSGGDRDASKSF